LGTLFTFEFKLEDDIFSDDQSWSMNTIDSDDLELI